MIWTLRSQSQYARVRVKLSLSLFLLARSPRISFIANNHRNYNFLHGPAQRPIKSMLNERPSLFSTSRGSASKLVTYPSLFLSSEWSPGRKQLPGLINFAQFHYFQCGPYLTADRSKLNSIFLAGRYPQRSVGVIRTCANSRNIKKGALVNVFSVAGIIIKSRAGTSRCPWRVLTRWWTTVMTPPRRVEALCRSNEIKKTKPAHHHHHRGKWLYLSPGPLFSVISRSSPRKSPAGCSALGRSLSRLRKRPTYPRTPGFTRIASRSSPPHFSTAAELLKFITTT